jgi:hypothetical protein
MIFDGRAVPDPEYFGSGGSPLSPPEIGDGDEDEAPQPGCDVTTTTAAIATAAAVAVVDEDDEDLAGDFELDVDGYKSTPSSSIRPASTSSLLRASSKDRVPTPLPPSPPQLTKEPSKKVAFRALSGSTSLLTADPFN